MRSVRSPAPVLLSLILLVACAPARVAAKLDPDEWVGEAADDQEFVPGTFNDAGEKKILSGQENNGRGQGGAGYSHGLRDVSSGGRRAKGKRADVLTWQVPLEHNLGSSNPGDFFPAGTFVVEAEKSPTTPDEMVVTRVSVSRLPLLPPNASSLIEFARAGALYTLRMPGNLQLSKEGQYGPPSHWLLTSTPASDCVDVAADTSSFAEQLTLYPLSAGSPLLFGFSYSCWPLIGQKGPSGGVLAVGRSRVQIQAPEVAPLSLDPLLSGFPSTSSGSSGPFQSFTDSDTVAPPKPPPPPPKTLLQKYWMYLIPVGLIFINALISASVPDSDGPRTTGSQGAARGGAGAARRRHRD